VSFKLQASSFKPAWAFLALILLQNQDAELDAAIKADRARIAARKPLTKEEIKSYRAVGARITADRHRFRLKTIPLSFTDVAASRADLPKALLEPLSAYYKAQSAGVFQLEPALLESRATGGPRSELAAVAPGSAAELKIIARVLRAEDLGDADGFLLVAAGEIGSPKTGLWPHASTIRLGGRDIDYVLLPERGDHRWFGIAAHEAGHLLKLEDKYGDREAKVGRWCLMGTGYLDSTKEDPRPGPLCAVCREGLGWAAPLVHDPASEGAYSLPAGAAAVKVPVNKDGKEAVVLEARGKSLLVWHTGGGRPIELAAILPTESRDRLTPWSDPPFRTRTLGATDVWITDARIQEGRAWFRLSPTADLTPLEALRRARVGKELGR
jgi:M6 family metalloprotease-like protein